MAAAHRGAIRAVSHVAVFPIRPRDVIGAGVDGVSHAVSAIAKGISPEASEWSLRATALAKRLGVAISTGTDRPEEPSAERKPALFDEIELLVSGAGFTPLEAITAATLNGARAIGIEKDRGTIEPGQAADFVVLEADPSHDIGNLRRTVMVIKGGVIHHP